MRSRGVSGILKKRRKKGSSSSGLRTRTRVRVYTFTTDGVTFSSTGASEGRGCPSTSAGKAAGSTVGSSARSPATTRVRTAIAVLFLTMPSNIPPPAQAFKPTVSQKPLRPLSACGTLSLRTPRKNDI